MCCINLSHHAGLSEQRERVAFAWLQQQLVTAALAAVCAVLLLQVLQQLASLQPAVDEAGAVLQPLPRAHVGLTDPACLPHIAQVILTGGCLASTHSTTAEYSATWHY